LPSDLLKQDLDEYQFNCLVASVALEKEARDAEKAKKVSRHGKR